MGQHDTQGFRADPRVRPAHPVRGSDTSKLPSFFPEAFFAPILNITLLVAYSKMKTPLNLHKHVHIHPHPLHQGNISPRGSTMNVHWFKIRGLNPRVERSSLAGRGDPTRDATRKSRVNRNLVGPVGSGQGVFQILQVRSGRIERFSNLVDRVGPGQAVFKSRGSGRVRELPNSPESGRVRSIHLKKRARSCQLTLPDPT